MRQLLLDQLFIWDSYSFSEKIDLNYLKIYRLLSGEVGERILKGFLFN